MEEGGEKGLPKHRMELRLDTRMDHKGYQYQCCNQVSESSSRPLPKDHRAVSASCHAQNEAISIGSPYGTTKVQRSDARQSGSLGFRGDRRQEQARR